MIFNHEINWKKYTMIIYEYTISTRKQEGCIRKRVTVHIVKTFAKLIKDFKLFI